VSTDRQFLRVRLEATLAAPLDTEAADRLAQWLMETLGAQSVELGVPPVSGQLSFTPVVVVDRQADVQAVAQQLAARLRTADGVRAVTVGSIAVATAYQRRCRVGGELFFARKPDTDICHGHWYREQLAAVTDQYRPLMAAIAAATGLTSYVWQSGGMTMTLVTPFQPGNQEPHEGDRYLTLVEGWHDDGRLEGSTGFYAAGDDEGSEGDTVVQAYADERQATASQPPGVFGAPIQAEQWAGAIADHYRRHATANCRYCRRRLAWGFVDYSDTPGWVHRDTDEALCRPDDPDSPQAEPEPQGPGSPRAAEDA
jgi:hypothetical protein